MLAYKIVDWDRIQGSHDHVIQGFHKSLKTQFLTRIPFHKRAKYFRRKCPTSFLESYMVNIMRKYHFPNMVCRITYVTHGRQP